MCDIFNKKRNLPQFESNLRYQRLNINKYALFFDKQVFACIMLGMCLDCVLKLITTEQEKNYAD